MNEAEFTLYTLGICLIAIGVMTLLIYVFVRWMTERSIHCDHMWVPTDTLTGWSVTCRHCNIEIMSNLPEDVATIKARFLNGEEPHWKEYPTDFSDAKWEKGKKDNEI